MKDGAPVLKTAANVVSPSKFIHYETHEQQKYSLRCAQLISERLVNAICRSIVRSRGNKWRASAKIQWVKRTTGDWGSWGNRFMVCFFFVALSLIPPNPGGEGGVRSITHKALSSAVHRLQRATFSGVCWGQGETHTQTHTRSSTLACYRKYFDASAALRLWSSLTIQDPYWFHWTGSPTFFKVILKENKNLNIPFYFELKQSDPTTNKYTTNTLLSPINWFIS